MLLVIHHEGILLCTIPEKYSQHTWAKQICVQGLREKYPDNTHSFCFDNQPWVHDAKNRCFRLLTYLLHSLICWHFRKQRDQGTPTDGCNLHTKPQVSEKFDFLGIWFYHYFIFHINHFRFGDAKKFQAELDSATHRVQVKTYWIWNGWRYL